MSEINCEDCKGSGTYVGLIEVEDCKTCEGTGIISYDISECTDSITQLSDTLLDLNESIDDVNEELKDYYDWLAHIHGITYIKCDDAMLKLK